MSLTKQHLDTCKDPECPFCYPKRPRSLQVLADVVKRLVGNDYLYFPQAVEVNIHDHPEAFRCWGIVVSTSEEVFLMDADEQWHRLETSNRNFDKVASALHNVLGPMIIQYKKAAV
jgi:hypothetical protein